VVGAETERSDISLAERKIDNDVEVVRTRMTRDQQRLDSGSVGSPKELENLQHELVSLARRQSELEDLELEQMELREEVERRLTQLQAEVAELSASRDAAVARRDEAFAEIDAEATTRTAERDSLAAGLRDAAAPLVDLYEKIRGGPGGAGAAALHRGQCQGCHLSLPPSDLARIKAAPDDEVLRCEECRRILVRRPDSGLG
jgi:predicted  nucleic acid-binding Zn-ribbon protein